MIIETVVCFAMALFVGCGTSQKETEKCERALHYLHLDMKTEILDLYLAGLISTDKLVVQDIKIKARDIKHAEAICDKSISEISRKCVFVTVPGMKGKRIKELSDDTPIYRCKCHKDHVILAKELKF